MLAAIAAWTSMPIRLSTGNEQHATDADAADEQSRDEREREDPDHPRGKSLRCRE